MSSTTKTTFVFCRHGQSELNALNHKEETSDANSPLSSTGKKQSEKLAKNLVQLIQNSYRSHSIKVIVSTLDRALDTAKPFLNLLDINNIRYEKTETNQIIEYIGPHKQLEQSLADKGIKSDETWSNFIDSRVYTFYQSLMQVEQNTICFVFSHGYFLSSLLSIIAVQGEYHGNQRVGFDISNCSKILVTFDHSTKYWLIHIKNTV